MVPGVAMSFLGAAILIAPFAAPLSLPVANAPLVVCHALFIVGSAALLALGPRYITSAEVGLLTEECERVLAAIDAQGEARAEGGLSGPSGRNAQKFVEESALLTRYLVEDQRVFAPAAELLR